MVNNEGEDMDHQDPRAGFDAWFEANGYDDEHRRMFNKVWDAALAASVPAQPADWYARWQEVCEKDHGPYPEDGSLESRLRWWVPRSARFGRIDWEDDILEAADALAAQEVAQPVVPAGWKLVPIEPTDEMHKAFWPTYNTPDWLTKGWAAMLAAAPTLPQAAAQEALAEVADIACACTGACRETGICPVHGGRMWPTPPRGEG